MNEERLANEQQRLANDQRNAERSADSEKRPVTERGDLPGSTDDVALLPDAERDRLQTAWDGVQVGFVDEPRQAVQQAHELVGQLVDALTRSFARQRDDLEGTWSSGADVSTEDLRLALQRYRSLFKRLLVT